MEGIVHPRAIVTLKVAHDNDKVIWVTDEPGTVLALINDPDAPRLVTLNRWRAMRVSEFSTRPDNVVNVEPYS